MASTLQTEGLSRADSLRSLVVAVITDELAPISIRNHCHRLMLAIEKNNQTLVDESLINLQRAAEDTGYRLPRLNHSNPTLERDRSSGAPEPLGHV
jgi:hypothetical protein